VPVRDSASTSSSSSRTRSGQSESRQYLYRLSDLVAKELSEKRLVYAILLVLLARYALTRKFLFEAARIIDARVTESQIRDWLDYNTKYTRILKRIMYGTYKLSDIVLPDLFKAVKILVDHLGLRYVLELEQKIGFRILDEKLVRYFAETEEELLQELEKKSGYGELLRKFAEICRQDRKDAELLLKIYEAARRHHYALEEVHRVVENLWDYVLAQRARDRYREKIQELEQENQRLKQQLEQQSKKLRKLMRILGKFHQETIDFQVPGILRKQTLRVHLVARRLAIEILGILASSCLPAEVLEALLEKLQERGLVKTYEITSGSS